MVPYGFVGECLEGDPFLQAVIELPGLVVSVPMTYVLDGEAYVAVSVGGPDHPAELVALTLPGDPSFSEQAAARDQVERRADRLLAYGRFTYKSPRC